MWKRRIFFLTRTLATTNISRISICEHSQCGVTKLLALAFRPGSAGVLDSVINYPHILWSRAKPGCSVIQCGRMQGYPQNFWVLVPHPFTLRREGARSTLKHVSSVDGLTCRPNSVAVAVGASTCSRSVQIIGTSGPPFKVIKITERYAVRADTCDFLLAIVIVIVISKNCGPTSYRFRDKRRYWTKTAHFPILCI